MASISLIDKNVSVIYSPAEEKNILAVERMTHIHRGSVMPSSHNPIQAHIQSYRRMRQRSSANSVHARFGNAPHGR